MLSSDLSCLSFLRGRLSILEGCALVIILLFFALLYLFVGGRLSLLEEIQEFLDDYLLVFHPLLFKTCLSFFVTEGAAVSPGGWEVLLFELMSSRRDNQK